MEQIRHNETGPVIDREKLLRDSQDRELNRLFGVLESNQFSVFDVEDTLIQLGQNNPKARPYIAQFVNSQNSSLESILMRNANNETRENPETTKRLNLYQNLTKDLQKSLQDIQKSLNDSTSLSLRAMDNIAGLFTDDTIFNTYNSSFESIKNQAKNILGRVQEIDISSLTTNQKEVYNKTISELKQILSLKLETTGFVQMVGNEIDQIPQNLNYTAHAIKGEVIGLYEGGKAIITGSIDLLTFMIKYPFNSKYRQEINKQAEIIYDFVKKEGLSGVGNKVYEAVGKEMDRISKLPPEKQSQAIGEIAGNVISMLAVIKVGTTVASKLGKVGQAERLVGQAEATGNIARAEKVREIASTLLASKRGLQSFEIILTGVAESVLLKGLSVSYKATLGFLENSHLSNLAKAELIEQKIQEARQMKGKTPEEQQILERYIEELESEKRKLKGKVTILDRSHLSEDIPRENLQIREITDFNNLSQDQKIQIERSLKEIIGNVNYNSFEKIDKLFSTYFSELKNNPNITLLDVFRKLNLGKVDIQEGSNCVGMSYLLQEALKKEGINSHLIRFDAGGLINNNYVENGHSALIIPYTENGVKYFKLADPGLLIPESMVFEYGKNSEIFEIGGRKYIIRQETKGDLPYMMEINSKKKLYFDPYNEWLNPNETLNKDIMRAIGDFKIVKQNNLGEVQAFYRLDIQNNIVTLKIKDSKIDISFKDFLEINNNPELKSLFIGVAKDLGQNPNEFLNKNLQIIQNIDLYKEQIWAPSTRDILKINK